MLLDIVHLTHSAIHWQLRCIEDSSSDENTPPNPTALRSRRRRERNGDGYASVAVSQADQASVQERDEPAVTSDAATNGDAAAGDAIKSPVAPEDDKDVSPTPPRPPSTPRHRCPCCALARQLQPAGYDLSSSASLRVLQLLELVPRELLSQRADARVLKCGNGLEDSAKIEHVSSSRANRPRNQGYRLVLKQRPEKPATGVCVAINAGRMESLMRFVNHSCRPAAAFVELSNGRRTTVVVVTTQDICRGEEVTVDYGDDLSIMGKNSGSTNYSMFDIDRLLHLVEQALPLGRDEWERLAVTYNSARARGAPERDFESLRRKLKTLYSARKPPEAKQAIDDKTNVIEIDDEADHDQGFVEPDFSFEADPDDDNVQHDSQGSTGHDEPIETDESVTGDSTSFSPHPRPAPLRAPQNARQPGAGGPPKQRKSSSTVTASDGSLSTGAPVDQGRSSGNPKKDQKYKSSSNRLGGTDLTSFRDAVGAKRVFEEDKETLEARFAKAKCIRAMKATTALKNRLSGLGSTANTMGGSIMETVLLLREENERKAEARRADEEKRRREEKAEAKAEAEERRRREKLEMEERARRDREEARARIQELLILIGRLEEEGLRQG
ncbi:hypothetical protein PHYSODRAFT_259189 [Phytophthora sojae]|uniref:SET domain-containing protein n=1 Tax=Phytophthora sojae (strain P6497) TaxID=1094619 RepID=G4ZSV7_PHYSP|nr:hypothetical protein PHYSODRAFT_259189 [Phytophthora sojae]EGZ13042.1 hypothetical protein PHYSODRAFT_259189 [Phytophthora sojae]|eukprot:XP_009530471.1 hypothetical protein PHYSODRAFT_259189 [Phytophthora sojae]